METVARTHAFFFTFKYKLLQTFPVADSGEGPGGPTPPLLFLD